MSSGILLDTHALLWALYAPEKLPLRTRQIVEGGETRVYASAVSAYEIARKHGMGKLDFAKCLAEDFLREIAIPGFEPLAIMPQHAQLAGNLMIPHRDPWDRLLIAQAQIEDMRLASNEQRFDDFGVLRVW